MDTAKDVDMVSFPSFKDYHYRVSKMHLITIKCIVLMLLHRESNQGEHILDLVD